MLKFEKNNHESFSFTTTWWCTLNIFIFPLVMTNLSYNVNFDIKWMVGPLCIIHLVKTTHHIGIQNEN
jgi:hypothetical protein